MTKEQLLRKFSDIIDLYTNKCEELGLDIDFESLVVYANGSGLIVFGNYTNPTDIQSQYNIRPVAFIDDYNQKIIWFEERHDSDSVPPEVEFYTLKDGKWQIDR